MSAALIIPVAVPYTESAAALPFPGDDPGALVAPADRLFDAAQHLARLDDTLFDARAAIAGAWRGTAATTGEAEIDRVRVALDEGTGRLYRARGALLALSDELTAVRAAVEAFRSGWLSAEGDIRALRNAIRMSDCATVALLQEELRLATLRRDAATTGWSDAVRRADTATVACAAAVTATVSGAPVFRSGPGPVVADLGAALGTDRMISDDIFRSTLDRASDSTVAWAMLGPAAQAFARATAGALPPPALGPALRAGWWRSRSWIEQQAVLHDDPQAVGGADGLPAAVRHQANLLALERRDAELSTMISAAGEPHLGPSGPERAALIAGLQRQRETITAIRLQLAVPRSQPVFLLNADAALRGQAVIAIGDPDTAAHVATYVPGTGSDVGTLGAELVRADAWSAGASEFGTHDVATIAWVGYDSPSDVVVAARDSYADVAAPALIAFQLGLRAAHQGKPAHATVVAHSYGGSVVAAAASGGRSLAADRLVLVASTGLELASAADLHLDGVAADERGSRVFAVMHDNDAIQYTKFAHDGDPYAADFGGQVILTDRFEAFPGATGLLAIDSPALDTVAAHGAYQSPGSVEQRVISALLVGAPVPLR